MSAEMESVKIQLLASQESMNPADGGPVPKLADLQDQVSAWLTSILCKINLPFSLT